MSARACGVYVHVPFCRRHCPYCDFAIEVGKSQDGYVDAVLAEWEARRASFVVGRGGPRTIASLSFGGGTPSSLPPRELHRLVAAVAGDLDKNAEVSLEVNPEDIDDDVATGLNDAGFTRVSVGLQSFDDGVLRYLGRAHDAAVGAAAIAALVATGVDVGVDLIVGVPGEGPDRLARDIDRVRALGVVHLSTYLLTVEPGTPLVRLIESKKREAVDDDAQATAYESIQELCRAAGFTQYEVSSYALPSSSSSSSSSELKWSRHNRLYWQRGDYLGLGPGAHGFVVNGDGSVTRRHNRARLEQWLRDPHGGFDVEELDAAHALREGIAFGLRDKIHGVDVVELAALHQMPVTAGIAGALERAVAIGNVVVVAGRHHLTDLGLRFADRVARDVLGADP